MHELIPRDEERIIKISDTHWHMDYYEKGFGVEWGEECREYLVRVSRSLLSLPFLFIGKCLVAEKIRV